MFSHFKNRILSLSVLLVLAVNIGFMLWYIFVGYQDYFHSDSATKVLLAREIFDTGNYFPRDWNYVNGDLFVFFGHTFIIPLLSVLPAGYLTHALSGAIMSGLILLSVYLLAGEIGLRSWRRLLLVAITAAGISGFVAENLYGQVSYGVTFLIISFATFLGLRFLNIDGKNSYAIGILICLLFFMVFWANPKRALVAYAIPLFGAIGWLYISRAFGGREKLLLLGSYIAVGCFLGSLLYIFTLENVSNVAGTSNARWLSFELVQRNTVLTIKGIFAILGGLPIADSPLFSMAGLYGSVRFLTALMLLVLIPLTIIRATKQKKSISFLALVVTFSLAPVLSLQVMSSIPDMSDPIQSSRYLVPAILLALLLVLAQPLDFEKYPVATIFTIGVMIVFVSSAYPVLRFFGPSSNLVFGQSGQISQSRQELIHELKLEGLEYGYASYWNAGALTVLSDEDLKVRPILIHHGIPVPMRHLSSNAWYRPEAWSGPTFLLLTEQESNVLDLQRMKEFGLEVSSNFALHGYSVFVFDSNISKSLLGWDQT